MPAIRNCQPSHDSRIQLSGHTTRWLLNGRGTTLSLPSALWMVKHRTCSQHLQSRYYVSVCRCEQTYCCDGALTCTECSCNTSICGRSAAAHHDASQRRLFGRLRGRLCGCLRGRPKQLLTRHLTNAATVWRRVISDAASARTKYVTHRRNLSHLDAGTATHA